MQKVITFIGSNIRICDTICIQCKPYSYVCVCIYMYVYPWGRNVNWIILLNMCIGVHSGRAPTLEGSALMPLAPKARNRRQLRLVTKAPSGEEDFQLTVEMLSVGETDLLPGSQGTASDVCNLVVSILIVIFSMKIQNPAKIHPYPPPPDPLTPHAIPRT